MSNTKIDVGANRKLWVEALRSGEYEQTTGWLRRNDGFCCLGVACDVYHKATGEGGWTDQSNSGYANFNTLRDVGYSTLPVEVAEWFGFKSIDGIINSNGMFSHGEYFTGDGIIDSLVAMNDTQECTFADIADVVEDNRYGIFE